jgi:thiol:disulfide interchange protein
MQRIAACLIAGWVAWQAAAAEPQWLTDFAKAQQQARAEKKLILLDFTGSDWCAPCKAQAKNVFSATEFLEYAKKNLVLVVVDFPAQTPQSEELKKANRALASRFDVGGILPTVILLSPDGGQLYKKDGYGGQSATAFIAELDKDKAKNQK